MKPQPFCEGVKTAVVDRLQLLNSKLTDYNEATWTYWCLTLRALVCFLLYLLMGSHKTPIKNKMHFRNSMNELSLTDLNVLDTIGVGGYAQVHLVRNRKDQQEYALKVINKAHIVKNKREQQICSEKNVLMGCQNEFIVRLYKTFRDADHLYLLMECCRGGELWSLIHDRGGLDEDSGRYYCAAVVEALDYLHQRAIVYRDLKPENVLIEADGIPKLVDFGFAKQLPQNELRTWTFCGTIEYIAPELILNKGHDWGVDIWALGVFLFEMLTGNPPFSGSDPKTTCRHILQGIESVYFPKYLSPEVIDLICKLCKRAVDGRIGYKSADEIRQDVWFKNFSFGAFRNRYIMPPHLPKQTSRYLHSDGKPLVTSVSCNNLNNWDWDATFDSS